MISFVAVEKKEKKQADIKLAARNGTWELMHTLAFV